MNDPLTVSAAFLATFAGGFVLGLAVGYRNGSRDADRAWADAARVMIEAKKSRTNPPQEDNPCSSDSSSD